MASRLKLQSELETLLGTRNVYFQPPETFKITYPCIIYNLERIDLLKADNGNFAKFKCYTLNYVTRNPDDPMVDYILESFSQVSFERQYKSDNLYHNVFKLYY